MCTRRGSLVLRYLRTNVDKSIKIFILYFINEYANYTMKFMQIKTSVVSSRESYSQKNISIRVSRELQSDQFRAYRTRIHHSYWVCQ
jgi:type III secretory pathway lipoprotein EscJ